MARKIPFAVAEEPDPGIDATPSPPEPGMRPATAPALTGMARSLQAAAAASIRDIDTALIDSSQFRDRIADDDDEVLELARSIRAQGQLIPILVSPLPGGRFRIVYGRRRLAALRKLGLPAKALVRDLDEDQAIIAQGQENSFRKDLSWIEKAMFARQLLESGKSDELVCDALNIDQKARREGEKLTGLSRMRQVTARLDPALVAAVGPAPKTGRDRWYSLSQLIEKNGFTPGNQQDLIAALATEQGKGTPSDERFLLLERLVRRRAAPPLPRHTGEDQDAIGTVRANARSATITVTSARAAALHRWIAEDPARALAALVEAHRNTRQQQ